ncbi:MAG: cytochrome c biogenesis protein CcsA, partial [Campylobacter sp.]|nr:cytochrome c biogenesis protein CcsA [Campylobacter sp.]
FNLSPEQMILGMNLNPAFWQHQKIVKITNKEIAKLINLDPSARYASFDDAFDANGHYKLEKQINQANNKSVSERSAFDNDLIKFDERLNVVYLTFEGVFFKFMPIAAQPQDSWLSPKNAFESAKIDPKIKGLLNDYLNGLQAGVQDNDWKDADAAIAKLKEYQRQIAQDLIPGQTHIKVEVAYNKISIFKKLVYFYMILGGISLFFALFYALSSKRFVRTEKIIFAVFAAGFAAHTLGLAMRWYIAGHAPWSDSYESMIYIGWSAALAGIIFFKRSIFVLCAASALASIVMLVAHMSFVNPQITNLVPVLKSYWLMIHVSVITASYGFLGLGCLLGILGLGLMVLKSKKNETRLNDQIRYIAAIDELSLILGLCLLTIGNFFGAIWANESWGRYWGWDSKETWAYVSIIVYAIVLHLRFIPKLNSIYTFLTASVFAYASVIMTYFGVNFYLTGMHSYASSNQSIGMANPIYYTIITLILLSAVAYIKRDVKTI